MADVGPERVSAGDGGTVPLVAGGLRWPFGRESVTRMRRIVEVHARDAGLVGAALDGFVLAVHEVVSNAVRHGGGRGWLGMWIDQDHLVAEVSDQGPGFPDGAPIAGGRPVVDRPGGRGLWLARQLTDAMLISDGPTGVTVSISVCLSERVEPVAVTAPVPAPDSGGVDRA